MHSRRQARLVIFAGCSSSGRAAGRPVLFAAGLAVAATLAAALRQSAAAWSGCGRPAVAATLRPWPSSLLANPQRATAGRLAAAHALEPGGQQRPTRGSLVRLAAGDGAEQQDEHKVRYLPNLDFSLQEELTPTEGVQIMPCFPLGGGGLTYVPDTEQILNIFEPRYRQMYSDILLSGGRRFVVPQITQDEQGGVRLTEVGVVFYLDDLKEVSEQTQDQVKYICSHKVIGRVHLRRVLNPRAFADRSTYLRVEVEDVVDTDADESLAEAEEATLGEVLEVASLQAATKAGVRVDGDALRQRNATRGAGFWGLVNIWQGYLQARFRVLKEQFENDLRSQIMTFLREEGGDIPAQVSLSELPERMQRQVAALQTQFQEDSEPLVRALANPMQALVQSDSHRERLDLFKSMVGEEKKRLEARLALQSIFEKPED